MGKKLQALENNTGGSEVSLGMFKDLQALVDCHEEENQKQFGGHKERIDMLEGQVDLLKKMGAPKGESGDGGAGLLDTLEEITSKLRKEMQEKLDKLEEMIKKVDDREDKMDIL